MKRLPVLWRVLAAGTAFLLFNSYGAVRAQDSTTAARGLEFVPLYNLSQQDAITQLYANLQLVGVTTEDIVITTLASVPNRLVLQGPPDIIQMAKEILATIDPPPPPPTPPPAEVIDSVRLRNISPADFTSKLDEIMNNFIGMVRLGATGENFSVFARNASGAGQITFYIPNLDAARDAFTIQPQGYQGYQIYIRATANEQAIITWVKQLLGTVDQPTAARAYRILNLYYLQVDEAIDSLKAAGYLAVNTTAGSDPAVVTALQAGQGPIIYAAPQVDSTTNELSTNISETGQGMRGSQFTVLSFPNPVATTDIHKLIIFGTPAEIASVERYLALIDIPARQVLIEAQVIELNVDDLDDLGLRQVSGLDDIISGTVNPVFPGESGGTDKPSGNFFTYNDNPEGGPAGSFTAALAALILNGRATVRARPKVVTVDGRQAIIMIGRQVPVVQETLTGDQRSYNVNFVPVGITLNIKPRIGRGGQEVQMQVDAVVSNVETLNNVVSELSLVAPELNTREVSTIVRIPNHESLILGGLISTQLETRTYRIPILGDLPLIGSAFRRTRQIRDRTEIIIVITPHVAEETTARDDSGMSNPYQISDPYMIPLGSSIFDNLDNVLFPGEYLLKQVDLRGIDMATGQPVTPEDEIVPYSANDPVMLTLLQVIRKLQLVDNLKMMAGMELPEGVDAVTARYHAEAFLIAYLRHLNSLHPSDIVAGRRLLVPAFPIPEGGFEQPELDWQSINYLSATRANPLLTGLAETIRWLDQQPQNSPLSLFQIPDSGVQIGAGPVQIDPATGLPIIGTAGGSSSETDQSDSGESTDSGSGGESSESSDETTGNQPEQH